VPLCGQSSRLRRDTDPGTSTGEKSKTRQILAGLRKSANDRYLSAGGLLDLSLLLGLDLPTYLL
jgi:hypothetical protein